jgi:ERF superfamily
MTDPDPEPLGWEPIWRSSTPADAVIPAFVKALISMEDIRRDAKVDAGPMKYRYATLGQVLDEVRPKLAAQGLVISQPPVGSHHAGGVAVVTTVFHESGQWLEFPALSIPSAGSTAQQAGSAISYARRYAILSICNLATEDDDGHAASMRMSPAEATIAVKVKRTFTLLAELGEGGKTEMRRWADREGKKLTERALAEDPDWLDRVGAYLDVLLSEDERELPADPEFVDDEPVDE